MNETTITVVGNVATDPSMRMTANGTRVVSFRMASTQRRWDKALKSWRDGDTLFWTVTCWRNTGDNVLDSLHKGQPVMVHGRVRDGSYEDKDGVRRTVFELEAYSLGHDLSRGVSAFTKPAINPGDLDLVPDDDEGSSQGVGTAA